MDPGRVLWTLPAGRMKGGLEHRVPSSGPALDVLSEARKLHDGPGLVFPSPNKAGRALSDMTLTKILHTTGLADRATVHGFRSALRGWASENTSASHAVMELSLAHRVGSAVEQAYARSDLLDQRRVLMDAWGSSSSAAQQARNPTRTQVGATPPVKHNVEQVPGFRGGSVTVCLSAQCWRLSTTGPAGLWAATFPCLIPAVSDHGILSSSEGWR